MPLPLPLEKRASLEPLISFVARHRRPAGATIGDCAQSMSDHTWAFCATAPDEKPQTTATIAAAIQAAARKREGIVVILIMLMSPLLPSRENRSAQRTGRSRL